MVIRVRESEDVLILDLFGQLTAGGGDVVLRDAVREHLDQDWRRFVINLRGLDKMDSAGLGELMACHWRIQREEGTMHIVAKDPSMVFEILMKVRLDQVFNIIDDERFSLGRGKSGR